MTAADTTIIEIARELRPSPAATLATWYAVCIESNHCGGTNFLHTDLAKYVIGDPKLQKNGSMVGRMHKFGKGAGLGDIGGYKIGADGRVLEIPPEMRALLPGAAAAQQAPVQVQAHLADDIQ